MNKFIICASLQALVATIFFACDAQQIKPNFNLQQVKDVIEQNNINYFKAFTEGDSSLLIDRYTDDCWIMLSNQPTLCGPEAAVDFFRTSFYQLGVKKGKFISIDIFGDGKDFVTEVGFYYLFELHAAGVIGVNPEDTIGTSRTLQPVVAFQKILSSIADHLSRKHLKMFLNIRTDGFLLALPTALTETIARTQLQRRWCQWNFRALYYGNR